LGLLGFWGLRRVEEWAAEEEAELGRAGALPKESGKKARIASSSISPPSAMGTRSPPAGRVGGTRPHKVSRAGRSGPSAGSGKEDADLPKPVESSRCQRPKPQTQ
jgi:hypothetical protein